MGSIFISALVYELEKNSFLKQERINLNLQLKTMQFISDYYANFSDAYFYSLISSPFLRKVFIEENEELLVHSIESNLTNLVADLAQHDIGMLVFAVIDAEGKTSFFYSSDDDPFSTLNNKLLEHVQGMRADQKLSMEKLLNIDGKIQLINARILNPLTMKAPIIKDYLKSKSVIVMFDLLSLDKILKKLNKTGYNVNIYEIKNKPRNLSSNYELSVDEELFENYWINITYLDEEVKKYLEELFNKILIYTICFVIIISLSLLYFISKNVTNPILALRKKILDVNQGKSFPEPIMKNDEISLLNTAYYDLYSKLKTSYDDSQVMINTDYLTKLNNRNVFNNLLEGLITRSEDVRKISLLYIDIDNFKHVNDNYGHEAGDVFLIEFSTVLRSLLRPTDIVMDRICDVSRLAGDEFGVVIYDYKEDAIIKDIALRVLSIFEDGFDSAIGKLPVSASIGISVYPRDGDTPRQLIVNADTAMYQAKKNGKNQYAFFSQALAQKAQREFQIELQLQSIDFTQFHLLYMPIIDIHTKKPIGAEALIRWYSPELGHISPDEFIPLAERKGSFKEIDLWVFKTVLAQIPELKKALGEQAKVSINISSAQLDTHDFIERFLDVLRDTDVDTGCIILEITETFSTKVTELVRSNLSLLKKIGFKLALDDFGSGYTSIIQLIDYPIDIIKIDKSMIDRIEDKGNVIVSSLTTVCQANGYSVTAEGVERKEQADILKKIGVNTIQGYYYCKPMSLDALYEKYARSLSD
jgi:diguanylate cyclase (GGDEF)-like protein